MFEGVTKVPQRSQGILVISLGDKNNQVEPFMIGEKEGVMYKLEEDITVYELLSTLLKDYCHIKETISFQMG